MFFNSSVFSVLRCYLIKLKETGLLTEKYSGKLKLLNLICSNFIRKFEIIMNKRRKHKLGNVPNVLRILQ